MVIQENIHHDTQRVENNGYNHQEHMDLNGSPTTFWLRRLGQVIYLL